VLSALVRMSEQAPFYLFITFVLSYGTKHLTLERNSLLNDTLVAAGIGVITIPLAGRLSDKLGRRRVYGTGIILTAAFAFPYFGLLDSKSGGLVLLAIVLSLVVHDIQYGPQAALIAESFDADVRYTGAGMGYQLASVVAGGPAPLIAAALLEHFGSSTTISLYIIGCAVVSMIALIVLRRTAQARYADAVDPLAEPTAAVSLTEPPRL
jgi:MFS family permease